MKKKPKRGISEGKEFIIESALIKEWLNEERGISFYKLIRSGVLFKNKLFKENKCFINIYIRLETLIGC